jgi:thymidylate synthase
MITSFDSLDELWLWTVDYLLKYGHEAPSRAGNTRELLGYVVRLNNPAANFMFNPLRRMSPNYAAAELIWYLSGEDDIMALTPYAPQYERFANDGIAHGAYGKRWLDGDPAFRVVRKETTINHESQLSALLTLLSMKTETRHAVLVCWNAGDLLHALVGDKKDLPCTLALHFLVRANKLYMTVKMRSNDVWLGTPYDIWSFTCLQMMVASQLGLGLGWYQHEASSLHVYDTNLDKVVKAATPPEFQTGSLEYQHNTAAMDNIPHVVACESHNRRFKGVSHDTAAMCGGQYTLLAQIAYMAASKWAIEKVNPDGDKPSKIGNKIMSNYMRWFYAGN